MKKADAAFGLLAEFKTSEHLLEAVRRARAEGYRHMEAYSPFPVEELAKAQGLRPTRLPFLILAGGLLGALLGFSLQYYLMVINYPLNVGGRPYNSWPAFILVTFELGVLFAAFAGFFAMLLLNRLPALHHPVFNAPPFQQASQARFFLCIEAADPRFEPTTTRQFLLDARASGVSEVAR